MAAECLAADLGWLKAELSEASSQSYLPGLAPVFPDHLRTADGWKRYRGSPLRYAGGKSLAVGLIAERLPADAGLLVSPFVGGGSVEVAAANELGLRVQAYDVFGVLVAYWQAQLANPQGLAERVARWWPVDADTYEQVKQRLADHWHGRRLLDDPMELAAHFWYNHNLSFGPAFLGWLSSLYHDAERAARSMRKVHAFRAPTLSVAEGSYEETIEAHPEAVLYCDPPYYLGPQSKMFVGLYPNRNFPVHHDGFDHRLLRDLLRAHPERWLLSINDCAPVRDLYAGYRIEEVSWQYTHGQGETRIGKNRAETGNNIKGSHELLISNY